MNNWENLIYSKNKQLNEYPYGDIISLFFRYKKYISSNLSNSIRLLELGCGAGNNLWFFAEQGCDVIGIDWSQTACNNAINSLKKRGQKGKVFCMNFDQISPEIGNFDIVIDRSSTYCGDLDERRRWISKVYNVMKIGSIIISTCYGKDDPTYINHFIKKNFSRKINKDTFTDFVSGPFKDSGKTSFVDISSLLKIFDKFEMIALVKKDENIIFPKDQTNESHSIFEFIGTKK